MNYKHVAKVDRLVGRYERRLWDIYADDRLGTAQFYKILKDFLLKVLPIIIPYQNTTVVLDKRPDLTFFYNFNSRQINFFSEERLFSAKQEYGQYLDKYVLDEEIVFCEGSLLIFPFNYDSYLGNYQDFIALKAQRHNKFSQADSSNAIWLMHTLLEETINSINLRYERRRP